MSRSYDLRIVERRAFDLLSSSIVRCVSIDKWFYINEGRDVVLPFFIESPPNKLHVFKTTVDIPSTNYRWFIKFVVSGNARLKIDEENSFGIDEAHTYAPIVPGKHSIELIVSPRSLFGLHKWDLMFTKSYVVEVIWDVAKVALRLLEVLRFIEELPQDSELRKDLQELLLSVLRSSRVNPSLKQIALALSFFYESGLQVPILNRQDIRKPYGDYVWLTDVYGVGALRGHLDDIPATSIEEVIKEAKRIDEELSRGFEKLKEKYPKTGLIYIAGHSHIDAAWLWPRNETVEKVLRTFSTIVSLINEYNFAYVQSSALYYQWVEEIDKHLFEKIKRLVNDSKWVLVGGMWIESDTQLIDGESLARQFLHGQRYFLDKFGRLARIGWIPDSFGFSGNLPQLMRKSGIEVFVTHKVMWNDTNRFPYHFFVWRGIDGTEIPVQILITSYNESMTPTSVYRYWSLYNIKDSAPFTVYSYGYGDGGGGPTREMLEYIELVNSLPGLPQVKHLNEGEYIEKVSRYKKLIPVWDGELYVEIHRGTYTTNLGVKNAMAEAEKSLIQAETLATISQLIGRKVVDEVMLSTLWRTLLFNQFHDIIPGSSIKEVYDDALSDLNHVINESKRIISKTIESLIEKQHDVNGYYLALTNTLPWKIKTVLKIPKGFGVPRAMECQEDADGYRVLAEVHPMGVAYLELAEEKCRASEGVRVHEYTDRITIENSYIVVEVDSNGDIKSVKLKDGDIEILREPAKLIAYVDKPGIFDAWDVTDEFLITKGMELKVLEKPKVISRGPIEACVEVAKGFEDSKIIQRMCLSKDLPYIAINCRVDWRSKGILVKHWFKTTIKASTASYDIPFGVIERPTIPKSSWDQAKFEVPAVRWADISDSEKGLAIIAPSRHGYSAIGGDIGLSIIRSPLFPNPWSDLGLYEFDYYLYPHKGDYQLAEVPKIAQEIIRRPISIIVKGLGKNISILKVDPPKAILTAFKPSYDGDGYVLRVYNPYKMTINTKLSLGFRVLKVIETDILELNNLGEIAVNTEDVVISLRPFEIKTLKLVI